MNRNKKNTILFTTIAITIGVVLTCVVVIYIIIVGVGIGFVALLARARQAEASHPEIIVVNTINSRCELEQDTSYFFYSSDNTIYAYSYVEEETIDILQEDHFIDDFAVSDQWIFYLLEYKEEDSTREELWRYDRITSEKEMIFEDIDCSYVEAYNGYLLYDDNDIDFFCPVDENPNSDSVSWMELFEEHKFDGNERFIAFNGMIIGRYYDKDSDTYHITCIREEGSGKRIVPWDLFGSRLWIDDDWYSISDRESRIVSEVVHGTNWDIEEGQLVVEDGRIIGILPYCHNPHGLPKEVMTEGEIAGDYLFQINLEINKISTIYETRTDTRIIGYEEGLVYLLNATSYKVSVKSIDSEEEEEEELFEIPKQHKIFTDWSNDHIIVRNEETVILIYSVEKGRVTFQDTDIRDQYDKG